LYWAVSCLALVVAGKARSWMVMSPAVVIGFGASGAVAHAGADGQGVERFIGFGGPLARGLREQGERGDEKEGMSLWGE
jgi:hypothetical protein